MKIKFSEIEALAYALKREFGRETAIMAIRIVGGAERLADIAEHRYEAFKTHVEALLRHPDPADELHRAALRLDAYRSALLETRDIMSQAYDNMKAASEGAATEMGKAGDFIRNHPTVNNDPEMQAMADRLTAASKALSAVDVDVVTGTAEGTASSAGTVSG
jgi:hypothetical protein